MWSLNTKIKAESGKFIIWSAAVVSILVSIWEAFHSPWIGAAKSYIREVCMLDIDTIYSFVDEGALKWFEWGSRPPKEKRVVYFKWKPPEPNWLKLNTVGSHIIGGRAGAGVSFVTRMEDGWHRTPFGFKTDNALQAEIKSRQIGVTNESGKGLGGNGL